MRLRRRTRGRREGWRRNEGRHYLSLYKVLKYVSNCRFLLGVQKEYVLPIVPRNRVEGGGGGGGGGGGRESKQRICIYKVIRRKTRASRQTKSEAD